MRTQGEDSCLPAKNRVLRRNQPRLHLDPGLPASRTEKKYMSIVQAAQLEFNVSPRELVQAS